MLSTRTRFLDFEALRIRGASAVTVVRLMMACNDLILTNQALDDWKNEGRRNRKSKQWDACRYFIRAQIGHLHEGLKIVNEIQKDPALSSLVRQCDLRTQEAFRQVQEYAPRGARRRRFDELAGQIRHNLTFHYDESGKLIERAIADLAVLSKGCSITRGRSVHFSHFDVADQIVREIVVHQIWKVSRQADQRTETDRIADEICQIFLLFLDFAGGFIWRYTER